MFTYLIYTALRNKPEGEREMVRLLLVQGWGESHGVAGGITENSKEYFRETFNLMNITGKMDKAFKAAELKRERLTKAQWEKFKMNEVQMRAHLAGLSCLLEEVFILSTSFSFTVYAITDDLSPVVHFFKNLQVDKQLKFYDTTSETINQLLMYSMLINPEGLAINYPGSLMEQSYHMAKEAGSIGRGLDQLLCRVIKKGDCPQTSHINPKTVNNDYFYS